MDSHAIYLDSFKQFHDNLMNDSSINPSERSELETFIKSCDLSKEISACDNDAARKKLISDVNLGFLWKTDSGSGEPKYQYLGKSPDKWNSKEELGFVIKKKSFIYFLTEQISVPKTVIENEIDEIILETDITEKQKRLGIFKKKYGNLNNKRAIAMMWSFRYHDAKDKTISIDKNKLPFILALPDYADGESYYYFKHKLVSQKPKVPRTLDTNIDNDVFRPGGYTFPLGKCSGEPGLKEIIHRPSIVVEICDLPEIISNYL